MQKNEIATAVEQTINLNLRQKNRKLLPSDRCILIGLRDDAVSSITTKILELEEISAKVTETM